MASHTAAAASPAVTQEALFAQAGIVAARGLGELLEVTALLAHQPVPAGPRVAIVSNAGGGGVLAADACTDADLAVPPLGAETRRELERLLPPGAACSNRGHHRGGHARGLPALRRTVAEVQHGVGHRPEG